MSNRDPATMSTQEILDEMNDLRERAWWSAYDREFWRTVIHGPDLT